MFWTGELRGTFMGNGGGIYNELAIYLEYHDI